MRFPLYGGCQCGAVRYRIEGPAEAIYHCHCSMCRKLHGALFVTFATIAPDRLVVERGAVGLARFDSSEGTHRLFCRNCGCQLFCDVDGQPHHRWFTPGTLDGGAHPGNPAGTEQHIFVGSKVPWYRIEDGLPQWEDYAP